MEKVSDQKLTGEKLTAYLGGVVALRTVQSICSQAGLPNKGGFDLQQAVTAIVAHFKASSEKVTIGKAVASAKREEHEASMAALELGKMSGKLVSRADYENNYRDAIAQGVMRISRLKELTERQKEIVLAAIRGVKLAPPEGDEREA